MKYLLYFLLATIISVNAYEKKNSKGEIIALHFKDSDFKEEHIKTILNSKKLKELKLLRCKLNDKDGEFLLKIKSLKRLIISGNDFTDDFISKIKIENLTFIHLSDNKKISNRGIIALIKSNKKLNTICAYNTMVDKDVSQHVREGINISFSP